MLLSRFSISGMETPFLEEIPRQPSEPLWQLWDIRIHLISPLFLGIMAQQHFKPFASTIWPPLSTSNLEQHSKPCWVNRQGFFHSNTKARRCFSHWGSVSGLLSAPWWGSGRSWKSILTEANVQGAPDLVIEILSSGDKNRDTVKKKAIYEKYGVKEYWIVDPDTWFFSCPGRCL